MVISVASGKGGTGKTTLSVSLAEYLANSSIPVTILDCDVEEPNVNLFLKVDIKATDTVYIPVPSVNENRCDGCGKCEDICVFNSIVLVKGEPLFFPEMCHACGGCTLVCPTDAITEVPREIGSIETGNFSNLKYAGGRLKIGEAISPPLTKAVKNYVSESGITIIDSPPGTSCPVIESVKESDYVVLVTEPTPFGLNDLKLAVEMVRELDMPAGVVINRSDIGDNRTRDYCAAEKIDIIAEIPESREIAERYSRGDFSEYFRQKYSTELEKILFAAGIKLSRDEVAL